MMPDMRSLSHPSLPSTFEPAFDLAASPSKPQGKSYRCSRVGNWSVAAFAGFLAASAACRQPTEATPQANASPAPVHIPAQPSEPPSATSAVAATAKNAATAQPSEPTSTQTASGYAKAGPIEYLEILTGGARTEEKLPMLVAIHGLGDTPEGFAGFAGSLKMPARVIVPRGLDAYNGSFGNGWSWFPIRARDKNRDALANGIGRASAAIAAGMAHLLATKPTIGQKVVVTGFSQGGMLSFALAVQHPELVSLAVPVGGLLPQPLWPKQRRYGESAEIVALHGAADKTVPTENAQETVEALQAAAMDAKLEVFADVGHRISPEILARWQQLVETELTSLARTPPATKPAQ